MLKFSILKNSRKFRVLFFNYGIDPKKTIGLKLDFSKVGGVGGSILSK